MSRTMTYADHVVVCYTLAIDLFGYLRKGPITWIFMFFQLLSFTMILTPAWINLLYYWFFSPYVIRNVSYSSHSSHYRNLLDIYLPESGHGGTANHQIPADQPNVIILVSGGAWVIGYKLWIATCARIFTSLGYIVVAPDYRNFPQVRKMC